jgi:glutathione S-transferase
MSAIELYNAPQSTCSQKVRLTLAEKGLAFKEHRLKLFAGDQLRPEYLELNPNGVVPTVVHDGTPIIDSSVIMEYLDEVFPSPRLSPSDPKTRAEMRAWLRFFEEVPTVAVRYPSYNAAFARHFSEMSEAEFRALAASKPMRDVFLAEMDKDTGFSEARIKGIRKTALRMQGVLRHSHYLVGDSLTRRYLRPSSPRTGERSGVSAALVGSRRRVALAGTDDGASVLCDRVLSRFTAVGAIRAHSRITSGARPESRRSRTR